MENLGIPVFAWSGVRAWVFQVAKTKEFPELPRHVKHDTLSVLYRMEGTMDLEIDVYLALMFGEDTEEKNEEG